MKDYVITGLVALLVLLTIMAVEEQRRLKGEVQKANMLLDAERREQTQERIPPQNLPVR